MINVRRLELGVDGFDGYRYVWVDVSRTTTNSLLQEAARIGVLHGYHSKECQDMGIYYPWSKIISIQPVVVEE